MAHPIHKQVLSASAFAVKLAFAFYCVHVSAQPQQPKVYPVQACAGNDLVRVLDNTGTLWVWGGSTGNSYGQMGLGDDAELGFLAGTGGGSGAWHFAAQAVSKGYRSIACSDSRTAAIGNDGILWMWGQTIAENKKLYSNAAPNVYRPKKVGADFVSVALGNQYVLAVRADGSLWAWGQNEHGQLGVGDTEHHDNPVKVGDNFARVVAGRVHSAGIKTDGSLWMWGSNLKGQIGQDEKKGENGVAQKYLTPVKVPGDYLSVGVGDTYSAAVLSNGDLMAWGTSRHGFGRGVEDDASPTPTRIGNGFSEVTVSESHSLAMTPNGDVWEWGWRTQGERNLDLQQVGIGFVKFDAGSYENVAIKDDNTLWVWGGSNWARLAAVGYSDDADDFGPKVLLNPTQISFPLKSRHK